VDKVDNFVDNLSFRGFLSTDFVDNFFSFSAPRSLSDRRRYKISSHFLRNIFRSITQI